MLWPLSFPAGPCFWNLILPFRPARSISHSALVIASGSGLAGLFDGSRDGADAVIATEAFGRAGEIEAALLPFAEEVLRCSRIRRVLRIPWREGREMVSAVGGDTGLIDQLVGILRAACGDDLLLDAERSRLLQNKGELLDRSRHHDRVGIRCLDLGQLRAHVLSGLVHRLDEPDLNVVDLEDLAEILSCAASPVVVDDKEVGLLDRHLWQDVLEGRSFDR